MNKLKNKIVKIKKAICTSIFVFDSLFLLGIIALITTNFIVNPIFGMYSIALFLVMLSVYLSNTQKK